MNLILFIHKDSSFEGMNLKKNIDKKLKKFEIQILQTFNSFKARLKQVPDYYKDVFIVFADSENRLTQLTSLIDLMDSKRILLILPDNSKTTLSIGHKFLPRYFTYVNENYDDLCAVVTKMNDYKK